MALSSRKGLSTGVIDAGRVSASARILTRLGTTLVDSVPQAGLGIDSSHGTVRFGRLYPNSNRSLFRVFNRVAMTSGQGWRSRWPRAALVMTPAIGLAAAGKAAPARHLLEFRQDFRPSRRLGRSAAGGDVRRSRLVDRRFQIHAGGRQGPSVAGASRGPRPRRADSGTPGRGRRGLAGQQPAPAQYDLGVAVGWKRFAVAGDVARIEQPRSGDRHARDRGRRGQLQPQEIHRPRRGRRRAQRQPRRSAGPSGQHVGRSSAAPTISAATSR